MSAKEPRIRWMYYTQTPHGKYDCTITLGRDASCCCFSCHYLYCNNLFLVFKLTATTLDVNLINYNNSNNKCTYYTIMLFNVMHCHMTQPAMLKLFL